MKKRIMSLILAFCIVLTLVPVTTAYAEASCTYEIVDGMHLWYENTITVTGIAWNCAQGHGAGSILGMSVFDSNSVSYKVCDGGGVDLTMQVKLTTLCCNDDCLFGKKNKNDGFKYSPTFTIHLDDACHTGFSNVKYENVKVEYGSRQFWMDLKISGPWLGTNITHNETVPSTSQKTGTKEHWKCNTCGKKFYDAACTQPVLNDDDLIIAKLTKPTPNASVNMPNYDYGDNGFDPAILNSPNDGATVTFYYSTENKNSGGTKWEKNKTAQTLNAGTYYMYAELSESENYSAYTTPAVMFKVQKADPISFITNPEFKTVYVNDIIDDTYFVNDECTFTDPNGVKVSGKFTLAGNRTWDSAGLKETKITFTPNSENYRAVTYNRTVRVSKRSVESVEVLAPITDKEYGTEIVDLGLPEEVEIKTTDGKKFKVPVQWDYLGKYDSKTFNEQELLGRLELSKISNEVNENTTLTAEINVKLTERKVDAPKYEDVEYPYTGSPISHITSQPVEVESIKYEYEGTGDTVYEKTTTPPTDVGTYKVTATFTMKYGYKAIEPISAKLTITKAAPDYAEPTAVPLYYNNESQRLISNNISVDGGTMEFSTDGKTWSTVVPEGTDAKDYTVYYRIVGDKNHKDVEPTLIEDVKINPKDITGVATVNLVDGSLTYNGKPQTQKIKSVVIEEGWELTADDYTVTGNTETNANEITSYLLKVTGKGNYTGTAYASWEIKKAELSVSVSQDGVLTYNTKPQEANPKFEVSGVGTLENQKITFSEIENGQFTEEMPKFTDKGTYKLYWKVTADNHNDKTGVVDIKINPKDILNAEITLGTKLIYNGDEQTQTIESVKVGENWYLDQTEYTVSENKGTNAGDYTLGVNGIGNYTGTATKGWEIEKAEQTINIIGVDDEKGIEATYGGAYTIVPTGTVGDVTYEVTEGSDVVSVSEDGALTFKKAGNAVVTVRAAGDNNHEPGTKTVKITVNKATVTIKASDKKIYTGRKAPDLSSPKLGEDYTVEGLIGSDVLEDSVTVKLAYETEPNTQKRGEYAIIPSVEGEDSRYNFEFENGTLTIATRPADKNYYTITAKAGKNGTISPSGSISVAEGVNQSFTFTPAPGYAIANVKIDGKSIGAVSSYTFVKVKANHTIEVTFVKGESNPNTGVSSK